MATILSRFINDLDRNVQRQIAEQNSSLGSGSAGTFEDYKFRVGLNKGLSLAVDIARQMLRQLEIAEEQQDGQLPTMPTAGGNSGHVSGETKQ